MTSRRINLIVFLLASLAIECLSIPTKIDSVNAAEGDVVIIGNTSDKRSQMENYWTGGKKKIDNGLSQDFTNWQFNVDTNIEKYCKSEQKNRYSAYNKYSDCLKTEAISKQLALDLRSISGGKKIDYTACYWRHSGYNEMSPRPWSYRYSCIKNAVEKQERERQYMDNH